MKKLLMIFGIGTLLTTNLFAESFTKVINVKVQDSIPVYKKVIITYPERECWDEEVQVPNNHYNKNENQNKAGALIGGIAGGILGHQIGGGTGKTVSTIGGAILGTIIGDSLANNDDNEYNYNEPEYITKHIRKCRTVEKEREETRFMGYRNIAYVDGKKIIKKSSSPLKYIRVRITYSW